MRPKRDSCDGRGIGIVHGDLEGLCKPWVRVVNESEGTSNEFKPDERRSRMKEMKKELRVMMKDLERLTKKTGAMMKKMDRLEKQPAARKPRAGAAGETKKATSMNAVLDIVKRSRKGIDTTTLRSKTGFDDNKMRGIVYRLQKQGEIVNVGRGVYRKA